ncbi:MAG: chromosome segregation protein SMC [Armatimonadetes bacterium]|nr:chromosome segregation protein SMC [Armatimonadota bacterium]
MKLKRVKIFGFKTFADRTDVELDGNIIAIIGPNGCGKSNIVDAILWGLGETNARHLRAQTAKEVIFSGSSRRKPLGFAEVSLLFDNEDGSLPIDTAEVSVTRRLTRSGDSDYSINKRACRLRDVNDLLADSGLGRAGYAIVTQSDIDQALSASALQRRAWIDEAAGVQRYRTRRTESLRRLDHAEGHLRRIHDILHEIEVQREPLREEAEAAKQYKVTLNALREIECALLGKELEESLAEIEELERRISATLSDVERENDRAESLRSAQKQILFKIEALDAEAERQREELMTAQGRLSQAQNQIELGKQKLESLALLEATLGQESESNAAQTAEAESALERARKEANESANALEALESSLGSVDAEARELAASLKALDGELAKARQAQAAYERRQIEAEHAKDRLRTVKKELQGVSESIPDLEGAVAENESALETLGSALEGFRAEIKVIDGELQAIAGKEDSHAASMRKLLAQIASLDGRRRGIEATIEANEGLSHGSRAVLEAVKAGRLPDSYTPVVHAIHFEGNLVSAVETALGAAGNDLIVPDESAAKEAIRFLKENRAGRATFQPVPLMRPQTPSPELRDLLGKRGVVGLASELVGCAPAHRPVIDSLLGRTVIVEDLDTALKYAKSRGWSRLVTLDGELIHASGAVTGGTQASRGNGIIHRKAELDQVSDELGSLQQRLSEMQAWDPSSEKQALQDRRSEVAEALAAQRSEWEEARTWLMSLKHELAQTLSSRDMLEAEAARLAQPQDQMEPVDLAGIELRRDEAVQLLAAKSSSAESAQARIVEARQLAAAAANRLEEADRRLAAIRGSAEQRQARLAHIGPERQKLETSIAEASSELKGLEERVAALRAKSLTSAEQRKTLSQEAMTAGQQSEEAQKSAQSGSEILHHCEIKRARADSRRSAAAERLLEEYGLSPEEALEESASSLVAPDAPALVAKLRRDLKAMGDVNLGAIEAFDRLTERHDELAGQSADVEEGMAEIRATIKELDDRTRQRFVETFEQLQAAFGQVFVKLLGGGDAEISLSDPANILDSGVEIAVTIPGKRRQPLELLSGGERAMSAIAFLFSLLKVKPCPLVILDEVDAPLDGRNVERFISMMREFNDVTQFILITHNNVTIESADVWMGVTMQEPGCSTVIPFRVPGSGSGAPDRANLSLA